MHQNSKRAPNYYFLIVVLILTTNIAACSVGEILSPPTKQPEPSFELFVFSNIGPGKLSHQATQSEYQDWLNKVDLQNTQFEVDNASIISSTVLSTESYPDLSLTLNTGASQNIIKLLEPNSEIASTLNGEYSLGCLAELKGEKAFLIMIQGKRIVGGTLRCPTQMYYTHPEMFPTSQHGTVLLEIRNTDASVINKIVSSLGS